MESKLASLLSEIEDDYKKSVNLYDFMKSDIHARARLLELRLETEKRGYPISVNVEAEYKFYMLSYRPDGYSHGVFEVAYVDYVSGRRSCALGDFTEAEIAYLLSRIENVLQLDLKLRYLEFAIECAQSDKIKYVNEAWPLLKSVAETEDVDEISWTYRTYALIRLWQVTTFFSLESKLDELETITRSVFESDAAKLEWGAIERFISAMANFSYKKYFWPRLSEWLECLLADELQCLADAGQRAGVSRLAEAMKPLQISSEKKEASIRLHIEALIGTSEAQLQSNPIGAYSFLNRAREIASKTGMRDEAADCESRLKSLASAVEGAMQPISFSIEVDVERLYEESGLDQVTDFSKAIDCACITGLPSREAIKARMQSPESGVFWRFANVIGVGDDSLPSVDTSTLGQVEDYHVNEQYKRELALHSRITIDLLERWTGSRENLLEQMRESLGNSPYLPKHMSQQFVEIIEELKLGTVYVAYMIPAFIEASFREAISKQGKKTVYESGVSGGYLMRTNSFTLIDELFITDAETEQRLQDAIKFILYDERGFNLRNVLYHGQAGDELFEGECCNLLVFVLLALNKLS